MLPVQRPHSSDNLVHEVLYDWAVHTAIPFWPRHREDNDPKLQKVYKEGSESTTVGRPGCTRPVAAQHGLTVSFPGTLWQQLSASASKLAPPQGRELGPQQVFGSFLHFITLILFQ